MSGRIPTKDHLWNQPPAAVAGDLAAGARLVGAELARALPPGVDYVLVLISASETAATSNTTTGKAAIACEVVAKTLREGQRRNQ